MRALALASGPLKRRNRRLNKRVSAIWACAGPPDVTSSPVAATFRAAFATDQDELLGVGMTTTSMADDADIAALTFEQALAELERIVAELESGEADLERAVDVYRRGAQLRAHCETKLKAAQMKVESIVLGADGSVRAEKADLA
jgi:exodeoxyribonuclease VII small subunit